MNEIFTGVGVALVTLFTDDGEVDVNATTELAAKIVGEGVTSVVVGGTTGEAAAVVVAELAALVGIVTLELGGHLVGSADPADGIFAALLDRQVDTLGLAGAG